MSRSSVRIAILASELIPPIGGAGVYATNLIRELGRQDEIELHVFTPRRRPDYDPAAMSDRFGHRVFIHNISEARDDFVYNLGFQVQLWRQLPGYHQRYRYDLIHAMNLVNMPDVFLRLTGTLRQVPTVVTAHTTIRGQVGGFLRSTRKLSDLASSERWSLVAYPYIRLLEAFYLRRSPCVITVSRWLERILRRRHGYAGQLETIENGIDLGQFNLERARDGFARYPELRDRGPIVLYAGRLVARKGLEVLAQAAARLSSSCVHFVFAGPGSSGELKRLMARNGVSSHHWTYVGVVDHEDLPYLYRIADIFVLPSYYESFPISLLEAMAMAVPCVASSVGGVSEIIDHGHTGLLVPAGEVTALVEAIDWLLADLGRLRAMGAAGHAKVEAKFGASRMAQRHREFYEHVLARADKQAIDSIVANSRTR